jgi:hypothetical protein
MLVTNKASQATSWVANQNAYGVIVAQETAVPTHEGSARLLLRTSTLN